MQNYTDIKKIGRGNYGTVSLARDVRNGRDYCLKEISLEAFSEGEREQAEQEVQVLRSLDHPGIVRYHEHFVSGETLCVVMAYCEGGDLSREIKRRAAAKRPFSEAQVLDWFVQMVMALRYVHSKRILHRDLKTQNIFIAHHQAKALIKLGDFGIAKVMEGSMAAASTVIGTPYYMSPEVCQNQPYSYKSDVWALGCILYEMCALQQAWNGSNLLGLVYKIVQQKYPPLPETYSPKLRELVGLMLAKLPNQRPSLDEILAMGFIREFLQSQLSQVSTPKSNPTLAAPAAPLPAHKQLNISSPSPARGDSGGFRARSESPAPSQHSPPGRSVHEGRPPSAGRSTPPARLSSAARLRSAVSGAASNDSGRDSGWDGSGGSIASVASAASGAAPHRVGMSRGSSRDGNRVEGDRVRRPSSGLDRPKRSSITPAASGGAEDTRAVVKQGGREAPPTPAARKDRPPSGERPPSRPIGGAPSSALAMPPPPPPAPGYGGPSMPSSPVVGPNPVYPYDDFRMCAGAAASRDFGGQQGFVRDSGYGWSSGQRCSSLSGGGAASNGPADAAGDRHRGSDTEVLTPTERMRRKKMEEADRRSVELKQALVSCYENRQLAHGIRSMHLRSNLDASCNLLPGVSSAPGSGVSSPYGCGSPAAMHVRNTSSACSSPHVNYSNGVGGTLRGGEGGALGAVSIPPLGASGSLGTLRPPPLGAMGSSTTSPLASPAQGSPRGSRGFSISTPNTPSLLGPQPPLPNPPSLLPQPSPSYLSGSRVGSASDTRTPFAPPPAAARASGGAQHYSQGHAARGGEGSARGGDHSPDDGYYEDDFEDYDGTTRTELILRTQRAAAQAKENNERDAAERQRLLQQAHDRFGAPRGLERADSAAPTRPNHSSSNSNIDDNPDVGRPPPTPPTRPAKKLLQDKCRETLGDLFPPVYEYLKKARSDNVNEKEVRRQLSSIVGRERLNDCFCVDQLVFTEEMMN